MKRKTWVTFDHQFTFATTRPKRHGRWLLLALFLTLIGSALTYTLAQQRAPDMLNPTASSATQAPAAAPGPAPAVAPAEPPGSKVDVIVRRNDTIEGIFRNLKLSAADLKTVLSLPGAGAIFKQLKPGDKITVVHDGAVLHAINRHISDIEVLSVTRGESGFSAERIITLDATPPQPSLSGRNS